MTWANGGYDDRNPSDVERANAMNDDNRAFIRCPDCGHWVYERDIDDHDDGDEPCSPHLIFGMEDYE